MIIYNDLILMELLPKAGNLRLLGFEVSARTEAGGALGTTNKPFAQSGATDRSRDGRAVERSMSRSEVPVSDNTTYNKSKATYWSSFTPLQWPGFTPHLTFWL